MIVPCASGTRPREFSPMTIHANGMTSRGWATGANRLFYASADSADAWIPNRTRDAKPRAAYAAIKIAPTSITSAPGKRRATVRSFNHR